MGPMTAIDQCSCEPASGVGEDSLNMAYARQSSTSLDAHSRTQPAILASLPITAR